MWEDFWAKISCFACALAMLCTITANAFALSKGELPVPREIQALMLAKDTTLQAPILMRSYKKESEIEIWKLNRSGRYVFLKTYPICRWSGTLGPKKTQGDRQTPEGFYSVGPNQMNPYSHYYLSFDTGYPNAYDRAHGGTGSAVMVHGTCSSAGCFAMTDKQVGEIFAIAREALRGGQAAFQFQAYPFRMTAANMAKYRSDPNIGFWRQLKEGSDRFEATGEELAVSVVNGRYVFTPSQDPAKEALAQAQRAREEAKTAALISQGSEAILTTYSDGGQNPYFATLLKKGANLGDVSRPEALALAGLDLILSPAKGACARRGGCPGLRLKAPPRLRQRWPASCQNSSWRRSISGGTILSRSIQLLLLQNPIVISSADLPQPNPSSQGECRSCLLFCSTSGTTHKLSFFNWPFSVLATRLG